MCVIISCAIIPLVSCCSGILVMSLASTKIFIDIASIASSAVVIIMM